MIYKETNEIWTLAIELISFGLICIMLIYLVISSKEMYAYKERQEVLNENLKEKSDKYFLENGEHIYGSDIVEFIVKYDANYDYYITLKCGKSFTITRAYARDLRKEGKNSSILYSQDYLTNTVFVDDIYKEYHVDIIKNAKNGLDFFIEEK